MSLIKKKKPQNNEMIRYQETDRLGINLFTHFVSGQMTHHRGYRLTLASCP